MTSEVKRTQLGIFGEKIVRNFFSKKGSLIEDTISMFDNMKDFTVDGNTVEVKTQQAFHVENAFSVKPNQVEKCQSVDLLIFVETPSQYNNSIKVWMAKNRNFRNRKTKDGRDMCLFDKSGMVLLDSITDQNLVSEARKLSCSDWKGYKQNSKY